MSKDIDWWLRKNFKLENFDEKESRKSIETDQKDIVKGKKLEGK